MPKDKEGNKKETVVLPYIRNVLHRLKKIASKHNIRVVFSVPFKLKGLQRKVRKRDDGNRGQAKCRVRHMN